VANPKESAVMNKEQYELVVKTDCWHLRRGIYLRNLTWCEICGRPMQKYELEVHHLSYDRIGNELDSDLAAACRPCHALLHGLPGAMSPKIVLGNLQYQVETPKRRILIARVLDRKAELESQAKPQGGAA
jgi:hypothetical protein